MALDSDVVEVSALRGVHAVEPEVVQDKQINTQDATHLALVGVVQAGDLELLGEPLGAGHDDRKPPSARDVSQRVGEEGLPGTYGAQQQHVVSRLHEAQRAELGPEASVVGHLEIFRAGLDGVSGGDGG